MVICIEKFNNQNIYLQNINTEEIKLITSYSFNEEFYWKFYTNKIIHLDKSYQLYSEPHNDCDIEKMFIKKIICVKSFYYDDSQKWLQLVQDSWIKI